MASVGIVSNQHIQKYTNYPALPEKDQFQQSGQEYAFANLSLLY